MSLSDSVKEVAGEELFAELTGAPKVAVPAVLSKSLGVMTYSPEGLVQCFIDHPELEFGAIAKLYGKTTGWVWACIASEDFQKALDPRRSEIHNPSITLTFKERFQTVALHAIEVLNKKLEVKNVDDQLVLGAIGLSMKALAINGKDDPAKPLQQKSLSELAGDMERSATAKIAGTATLGTIPNAQIFDPSDYVEPETDGDA